MINSRFKLPRADTALGIGLVAFRNLESPMFLGHTCNTYKLFIPIARPVKHNP